MFSNQKLLIPQNKSTANDPQSPISNLLRNHAFTENKQLKNDQPAQTQEYSYFTSEPQEPSYDDIKNFKQKMDELNRTESQNIQPFSPSMERKKSQRLQDQQIIVVEEQNEAGSNFGSNQSLIIEHIDFNQVKNEQSPQQTPRWDLRPHQNITQQKFQGNFLYQQPAWMVDDQSNLSSSPRDFQFESKKKSIRHSKNTCIDRQEFIEMSVSNKSCIAKPMGGQQMQFRSLAHPISRFPTTKQAQKSQKLSLNQVLDKWDNQIYPQLSDKHCIQNFSPSKYNKNKQQYENNLNKLKQSMKMQFQNIIKQKQTKNTLLHQQNQQLKQKMQKLQQQNQNLKKMVVDKDNSLSNLKIKLNNIQQQHIQISKTANNQSNDKINTINKHLEQHESCLKQIADLQQYIFDIQQKLVGIDIQVQKRVKIIEKQITEQIQQKMQKQITKIKQTLQTIQQQNKQIQQQFNKTQQQLKNKNKQLQQLHKQIQSKNTALEKYREKQKTDEFNKNHQQLQTKLKFSNFQPASALLNRKLPNQNLSRASQENYFYSDQPEIYPLPRQKKTKASLYDQQNQLPKFSLYNYRRRSYEDPQKSLEMVSKSLFNDNSRYNNKVFSRIEEQDNQLFTINSKIQRLKNQINRQLCSMN